MHIYACSLDCLTASAPILSLLHDDWWRAILSACDTLKWRADTRTTAACQDKTTCQCCGVYPAAAAAGRQVRVTISPQKLSTDKHRRVRTLWTLAARKDQASSGRSHCIQRAIPRSRPRASNPSQKSAATPNFTSVQQDSCRLAGDRSDRYRVTLHATVKR
jgi:hypothetical protein